MQYGCIGKTLKHSFSAEIHPLLSDATYELREVAEDALEAFMTKRDFRGINVTIPYKQAVIPYLFHVEEDAKRIGAVNTIVNREGRLYGYNTDFFGMCALLEHIGADLKGKKVAILGTGGTSLTAMAVAEHLGSREILRVSRSHREGCITYPELAERHLDIEILINTTPCGMYPSSNEMPVDPKSFPKLEAVADAVYNPLRTQLILRARACGIPAEGGLFMLVAQAVRAAEIFHNCTYPREMIEGVWQKLSRRKENIVLIGMPGSGKTTVGELLAKKLGRPFCDMDAEITKVSQRHPSEILQAEGEPVFRDLESRVLRERIADRTGEIIATGGGAVLREENVEMLKRNGRLYFLDRHWKKLIPTEDRPLSGTVDQLERRYHERYDIYCAAASVKINDPETAEEAAEIIGKDFF